MNLIHYKQPAYGPRRTILHVIIAAGRSRNEAAFNGIPQSSASGRPSHASWTNSLKTNSFPKTAWLTGEQGDSACPEGWLFFSLTTNTFNFNLHGQRTNERTAGPSYPDEEKCHYALCESRATAAKLNTRAIISSVVGL